MPELVIYRGLPASGKTTLARAWVAEAPLERARVNRDDLRAMLHDGVFLGREGERLQIVRARDRLIEGLLGAGISVASDDTNLPNEVCRDLQRIAVRAGATVRYIDLTDVPVDECIERDAVRRRRFQRAVGASVILGMHERFVKGRPSPLPTPELPAVEPVEAYVPNVDLPPAWLVDLDGTLAIKSDRSPYDWHRVGEDAVNEPVAELVLALRTCDGCLWPPQIIVLSGRDEVCRPETTAWLREHDVPFDELLMRLAGDTRRDSVVKLEIFRKWIAPRFNVRGVIDDRRQVVEMWRSLGLVVAQVAPGDF